MFLNLDATYDEYRHLNSDAHRLRTANCQEPHLTWHQAFWITQDQENETPEMMRLRTKDALDRFLLRIVERARQDPNSNCVTRPLRDNRLLLFTNVTRPQSSLLDDTFRNYHYSGRDSANGSVKPESPINLVILNERQRDIFDSDHRSVIISFDWMNLPIVIRSEFHLEYFNITVFLNIENSEISSLDLINSLKQKMEHICKNFTQNDAYIIKETGDMHELLFEKIWTKIDDTVFSHGKEFDDQMLQIFKHIVSDFRGLIIDHKTLKAQGGNQRPAARDDGKWGEAVANRYSNLLRPPGESSGRYECVANYMVDKRVLYMSVLGPQVPQAPVSSRVPVTYLLCVNQNPKLPQINEWQLGRLVHTLHLCGMSRIAALKQLGELRTAGTNLAGMDRLVAVAREAVASDAAREAVASNSDKVINTINAAHVYFNKITNAFNAATKTNYGILFRVERSRYYVSRFHENLKFLHISRIEGYQRYDNFIERRLGTTFDFIDRLGRRYERAVNSLSLLDRYNQSIKSIKIEIDQGEINKKIVRIQEVADFALLSALVPYYLTSLMHNMYPGPHNKIVTLLIWGLFLYLAFRRTLKARRKNKNNGIKNNLDTFKNTFQSISCVIFVLLCIFNFDHFIYPFISKIDNKIIHSLEKYTPDFLQITPINPASGDHVDVHP